MRGIKIGQTICEALIKLSPNDAKYFESNYAAFKNKLDAKIKEWSTLMTPYKGTKIIAYHNEWPYFEERFGLRIVDFLEPKPGIPPTPGQLSKVINEIKEQNIKVIISSPYFTTESADLVARQSGAKVVVLATSVGADKSIKNYIDLFDYNIKKLIDALK
jgi:ABC-type Zn uptake system ZnuABC Zn-binding protein ZnuA